MSLEPGQIIEGKYRITRLLGEGGMGAVFEGENVKIQRRVAIKVLHPAFTGNSDVAARFQREAQAAGRIGNDHILEVLDIGALPDGSHFMVLEFLDGQTLSDRVRAAGRLTPLQVAPLARQILKGLGAAHDAGIVHRDLKPDNIFILKEKAGQPDYVKIIDFGISKFQPLSGDGMRMTSTGAVMGTPFYMSPEQASGSREADGRSDLYAVGVILYECVTGRVPFDGETFNQLMFKIVLQDPPSLHELVPDLDPAFSSIILKAMARDMNHRFQTATDFSSAIGAWIERGAKVSIPPSPSSEAMVPGATRGALESVAGMMAPTNATRSGSTGASTWATSQAGMAPAKNNKMVLASIAGGLGFAALIAGFALFHGGSHAAASAVGPSAQPSVVAAAVPPAAPAETVEQPVVAPVQVAPAADKPVDTAKKDDGEPKLAAAATPTKAPSAKPAAAKSAAKRETKHQAEKAGAPDFGY